MSLFTYQNLCFEFKTVDVRRVGGREKIWVLITIQEAKVAKGYYRVGMYWTVQMALMEVTSAKKLILHSRCGA